MQHHPKPPCPRCGRTDLEIVSRREVHQRIRGYGPRADEPYETVFVFRCQCGLNFTHEVRHQPSN